MRVDGTGACATCGDGNPDPGETCHDGYNSACGECNSDCTGPGSNELGMCGDGDLCPEIGEECDDGNTVDTNSCLNTCVAGSSGDGNGNTSDCCPDFEGWCVPATCLDGFVLTFVCDAGFCVCGMNEGKPCEAGSDCNAEICDTLGDAGCGGEQPTCNNCTACAP